MDEFESTVASLKEKYPDVNIDKIVEASVRLQEDGIPPFETLGISKEYLETAYGYGYRAFYAGKFKDALGIFLLLSTFNPLDERFILGAAQCYHQLKRYLEAIPLYQKLFQLNPEDLRPIWSIYECFLALDMKELAFSALSGFVVLSDHFDQKGSFYNKAVEALVPLHIEIQELKKLEGVNK